MTTYQLHAFPSDTVLATFTVRTFTALADELRACGCPGLSVVMVEALLEGIERGDEANYGSFTLRRLG